MTDKPKPKLWRCVHCGEEFTRSPWVVQKPRIATRPPFRHRCGDPPVVRHGLHDKSGPWSPHNYPRRTDHYELTAFGKVLRNAKQEERRAKKLRDRENQQPTQGQ